MKDQYERAMKLHMSNKINEKNVYQLNLNLIDCIHQGNFSNDRFLFSRFSHIYGGYHKIKHFACQRDFFVHQIPRIKHTQNASFPGINRDPRIKFG